MKRDGQVRLTIVPCELAEANAFVAQHHRHHGRVVSHRYSLAAADETGTVRGVAIIGRPSARMLCDGWTVEVTRVATDGCPNACSALYAAAWKAARAMGYRRLVTYILDTEPGTSLRALGWKDIGVCGGGSWNRAERPRVDKHPTQPKLRFEIEV